MSRPDRIRDTMSTPDRIRNARDAILDAVRRGRPPAVALPDAASLRAVAPRPGGDAVARFADAVRAGGGDCVPLARAELLPYVDAERARHRRTIVAPPLPGAAALSGDDPRSYADVDLFVCEGVLGVAENGAVWLPQSRMGARAAHFLAQHVIVVLARAAIVETLHDAYARLDAAAEPFGAFVAGPSKTADIEQSLVIGAHGPRSWRVLLTDE